VIDEEPPAGTPLAGEKQPNLEVVALLLYAALNTASRQPFRAGRSPLATRLLLAHHDVRNRLPVGHKISPDAHAAARPYIEPAAHIKDPNASVVHLLEGVREVLADHSGHDARLSELAIKVSDLLQEAKSAPSF
jgi:hypothetical protein